MPRRDPRVLAERICAELPPPPFASLTALMNSDQNRVGAFFRELTADGASSWPQFPCDAWPLRVKAFGLTHGQYPTVGTAFGWWLRLRLQTRPHITEARLADAYVSDQVCGALDQIVEHLHHPDGGFLEGHQAVEKLAVVLTWCEQVYRSNGMALPSTPLAGLPNDGTLADLMAAVPEVYIDQLRQLGYVAEDKLFPAVKEAGGARFGIALGTYETLAADADGIMGDTLIEVKTTQGIKRGGQYEFKIDPPMVRQLIGYSLLDSEDSLGVRNVAVYSSRYGVLWTIPLDRLIRISGNITDDLLGLRAALATLFKT